MGELDKAITALKKKFGKNYIGTCDQILDKEYKRHDLGIFTLNWGTGGGLPERKVMMIAGKESSGKTSTMLKIIASVQAKGGKVALIDIEHGFDPIWANKLGVKVDELIIAQSKTVEEASDTIEPLIMTGELDLICMDSVAAAMSIKELDDSAEQKSMGGKAKAIGLMVGKITARLNDVSNPVKTSVILLNQIRDNVGGWGNPEYTPGGRQLHFQSDIIVWLRPDSDPVGGKETPRGINIKFKVTKNRTSPPFKTGNYYLLFKGEVDNRKSIVEKAIEYGIVKKAGPWFSYQDIKVSGLDAFMSTVDDKIVALLEQEVLKIMDNPPAVEDAVEDIDITSL